MPQIIHPVRIGVIVTHMRGLPRVILRRSIAEPEIYKDIIACAFDEKPMLIIPTFNDKLKSVSSLIQKGIMYYDENKKAYEFLI